MIKPRKTSEVYDNRFFSTQQKRIETSPGVILPILFQQMPVPRSVIDVGCGTGEWLEACKALGAREVLGLDGDYVDRQHLRIDALEFQPFDLSRPIEVARKFDLAICLEVAEHLRSTRASAFVRSLCRLSDTVLFSAATPGQGGTHHVNEQWPAYWVRLFGQNGFGVSDCIRPAIWENAGVAPWYRQNILVCRAGAVEESIPSRMHHEIYGPTIRQSLTLLGRAVSTRLKQQFGLS
jgi:SAM-dependent methyltransferase